MEITAIFLNEIMIFCT